MPIPAPNHTDMLMRRAALADVEPLRALQARSLRQLGVPHYPPAVIETFLHTVGKLDEQLIASGRLLVAEGPRGVVGCGGWTDGVPSYAREGTRPPKRPEATVRSVYVQPDCARRGIARALMEQIEQAIAQAGFDQVHLMATLSGLPLYERLGYRRIGAYSVEMPDGMAFPCVAMSKPLEARRVSLATRPSVAPRPRIEFDFGPVLRTA